MFPTLSVRPLFPPKRDDPTSLCSQWSHPFYPVMFSEAYPNDHTLQYLFSVQIPMELIFCSIYVGM